MMERRGLLEALAGDSVMDTAPLRRLIDKYLGDAEIAKIAAEGRKGRKLLIGTTNLNTARPVVWDLTKIADSGSPGARQLIGDLILASSAIPGVFPPLRIGVEAGGVRYEELHVDGGVTAQLFLDPPGLDWRLVVERFRVQGRPEVYVIRNARAYPWWTALRTRTSPWIERLLDEHDAAPIWEEVEPRVPPIHMR
jgi:patatin-like phospholipase/acyl hydrolase